MAYTEIGSDTTLKLKIPTKGTTNWDEELKANTFQKIADHDHTGTAGKGSQITSAGIQNNAIIESKIADDAIQPEHKKCYQFSPEDDEDRQEMFDFGVHYPALVQEGVVKITYKIKSSDGRKLQIGTLHGVLGNKKISDGTHRNIGFITDDFVGTDMGYRFYIWQGDTEIDGETVHTLKVENTLETSGDVITYHIEFVE